ncbi:2,3-bisphosphoglycerate-dependent phosphoglycerate mutase [Bombilactobacillus thymidiniphilus]|uniref:2,3-bisphosphoglycerate-dependent phosphoglycerate mutase n=1 Tax=Bombilactobacillus thymidiniphilus TaxID=2923363 RepID=A0ABY4PE72_9LACO|nr:2,3-diphosphoglycerate-dependent phosphoglycerate mutase [Bombilactobacillus thymidiniphilus]UQS83963.1 2,3-diphosphoglycerate-dependent phosphoglycerate mutase [Bombilactobacillus thymidiniphilus]
MVKLILVRHGQSIANARNEYTGWSDVDLTPKGRQQAHLAGQLLKQQKISFEQVHTSVLKRAIQTALVIMAECGQVDRQLTKSWRLNERHYGALRGLNKELTRQEYGAQQVAQWRRSYESVPPALKQADDQERIYQRYPKDILPRAESLAMALKRTVPYFQDTVAPLLLAQHSQLIVAHGSTLRALIKYLENISDTAINCVEVGNAQPIVYELDERLAIVDKLILR